MVWAKVMIQWRALSDTLRSRGVTLVRLVLVTGFLVSFILLFALPFSGATAGALIQFVTPTPPPGVEIDIKPGSDPNSIDCDNQSEVIPVAILTTDDFDATTVDDTTVTFEGARETHVDKESGEPRRHEEDVDEDGDTDLVFHFRFVDTDLTCGSTEGTLIGETFDGQAIAGTDSVRRVGLADG